MGAFAGSGLSLGTLSIAIQAQFDEASRALSEFGQQTEQFISDQKTKWESLGNIGSGLMGVGAALSGITVAMGAVSTAAVTSAEGLNTAKVAFTTLLGSAEAADKMLNDIKAFAATTPFEFPDLVTAAQRMKALGFQTDQIIPTLKTVGDTVAASGKLSQESVDGIITALGQMQLKGKTSTEEINQLMERGVDAWGALAAASGTSVADVQKAVEKGLIPASEAVPAILASMSEKAGGAMEKMSQTLTGQWSNFKDQVTAALVPIGNALIPALQSLLPILTSVMDKVKQGAEWFAGLPQPVQNAALAVAAMAAAIGPLLLGVGGMIVAFTTLQGSLALMGTSIGAVVLAVGPWVLAIGAALAALVALGTWVYTNWEPIVAVLKQAWDGIQELWSGIWNGIIGAITGIWNGIVGIATTAWEPISGFFTAIWDATATYFTAAWDAIVAAVSAIWNGVAGIVSTIWDPIATFFSTIWDGIATYFGGAWTQITGALTSTWNSVKGTAETVWNYISGKIKEFIEWCGKIPGVNKLFNLDDAWKSAEKLGTKTKDATGEVKKLTETTKPAVTANKNLAAAVKSASTETGTHAKKTKEAHDETKPLINRNIELDATYKELVKRQKDAAEWLGKYNADLIQGKTKTEEMIQPTAQLTAQVGNLQSELFKVSTVAAPPLKTAIDDIKQKSNELDAAFKTLGMTSATEYAAVAANAKLAYDAILQSPNVTQWEKDNAMVKVFEAQRAAAVAAGEQIPKDYDAFLADLKSKVQDPNKGVPSQKTAWEDMSKQVSTIVTNFAQDIGKSLFDGDLSFGEKAKGMLKSLGSAAVSTFVEPAMAAFNDLLNGVIKDLIGGKGFGGIKDSIKDAAKTLTDLFGKDGSAVKDAADGIESVTKPATPGGGGGGAGAAASGGLSGWITAISSVVTAISSFIQNFQLMKMETSLNAIEHNTRYSMMYLGERSDGGILGRLFDLYDKMQWVPGLLDGLNAKMDLWLQPAKIALETIQGQLVFAQTRFDEISSNTHWGLVSSQANERMLTEIRDMMRTEQTTPSAWTVSFTGDPIARMVGDEIMRQLRLQGVRFA